MITKSQRDEDANFELLKHFFWRYLRWDQRIIILVRAAVIGATKNRLPQTIEHNALLRAKEAGKLVSVWDDIMFFIPQEKRMPNPFEKEVTKNGLK